VYHQFQGESVKYSIQNTSIDNGQDNMFNSTIKGLIVCTSWKHKNSFARTAW